MTTFDLKQVLALDARATAGPWESDGDEVSQHWSRPEPWQVIASKEVDCGLYCYGGRARGIEKSEDAELIAYYRTAAPAMAKALQAVLSLHRPEPFDNVPSESFCVECLNTTYPCLTVETIHKHLGEQG